MAYHMETTSHRKTPRLKPLTPKKLAQQIEQNDTIDPYQLIKQAKATKKTMLKTNTKFKHTSRS
jgi:hypothetical protein